jgi:hypothetical protein
VRMATSGAAHRRRPRRAGSPLRARRARHRDRKRRRQVTTAGAQSSARSRGVARARRGARISRLEALREAAWINAWHKMPSSRPRPRAARAAPQASTGPPRAACPPGAGMKRRRIKPRTRAYSGRTCLAGRLQRVWARHGGVASVARPALSAARATAREVPWRDSRLARRRWKAWRLRDRRNCNSTWARRTRGSLQDVEALAPPGGAAEAAAEETAATSPRSAGGEPSPSRSRRLPASADPALGRSWPSTGASRRWSAATAARWDGRLIRRHARLRRAMNPPRWRRARGQAARRRPAARADALRGRLRASPTRSARAPRWRIGIWGPGIAHRRATPPGALGAAAAGRRRGSRPVSRSRSSTARRRKRSRPISRRRLDARPRAPRPPVPLMTASGVAWGRAGVDNAHFDRSR